MEIPLRNKNKEIIDYLKNEFIKSNKFIKGNKDG